MSPRILITFAILACTGLTGCVQETPQNAFGRAYRQQLAAQKLNPEPAPATPVVGMNGRRALQAMEAYRDPQANADSGLAEVMESQMRSSQ